MEVDSQTKLILLVSTVEETGIRKLKKKKLQDINDIESRASLMAKATGNSSNINIIISTTMILTARDKL